MVENLDVNGYTYFRILSYSGARKSEILALKWSDIDFDTSTLNISKILTRGLNNKIIMQPTKTVNGRRVIDMDYDSMKLLKLWKMYQAQFMLKLGFNTNTHDQLVRKEKLINGIVKIVEIYLISKKYFFEKGSQSLIGAEENYIFQNFITFFKFNYKSHLK